MRKTTLLTIIASLGCGGAPSGGTTALAGVQLHDRAALEQGTYYIDATVSDAPVLPAEIADVEGAFRVRLVVGDGYVAAFAEGASPRPTGRGEGTAVNRLAGAWQSAAVGEGAGAGVPAQADVTTATTPGDSTTDTDTSRHAATTTLVRTRDTASLVMVEIDWSVPVLIDEEEIEHLISIHPGCL